MSSEYMDLDLRDVNINDPQYATITNPVPFQQKPPDADRNLQILRIFQNTTFN